MVLVDYYPVAGSLRVRDRKRRTTPDMAWVPASKESGIVVATLWAQPSAYMMPMSASCGERSAISDIQDLLLRES